VEIKMTAAPNAAMAKHFKALDDVSGMKRGTGMILCQCERKTWLSENLAALPDEYGEGVRQGMMRIFF